VNRRTPNPGTQAVRYFAHAEHAVILPWRVLLIAAKKQVGGEMQLAALNPRKGTQSLHDISAPDSGRCAADHGAAVYLLRITAVRACFSGDSDAASILLVLPASIAQ